MKYIGIYCFEYDKTCFFIAGLLRDLIDHKIYKGIDCLVKKIHENVDCLHFIYFCILSVGFWIPISQNKSSVVPKYWLQDYYSPTEHLAV